MTDTHDTLYRSIANPRRTTLVSLSAAEAATPQSGPALQMLGDDGGACVDGVCALPEHAHR